MWLKRREVHVIQNLKHGFIFASCITLDELFCLSEPKDKVPLSLNWR